jgi:sulfide:quinone oxidoreductase
MSVLIAGGGVAGLEAVLALRELAGTRVAITLLSPEPEFAYRAPSVGESFSAGHGRRFPLDRIAEDLGFDLVHDGLAEVFVDEHSVRASAGAVHEYDALVIAMGARQRSAYPNAMTYAGDDASREALSGLLADLEGGYVKRIAFVVPHGPCWQLPLYELALMTAREAWDQGIDEMQITVVSPEDAPLAAFGINAAQSVVERLESEGIAFVGSTYPEVRERAVILQPGGRRLEVDRVISLPALEGPRVAGVPADETGFLPTDHYGRVTGAADVYAAGDGTDFPIKQGGLATQQADVVAGMIAATAGAPVEPAPFRPVLRGMLLTGGDKLFLRHAVAGGDGGGQAEVSDESLWWPMKIAGRYLSPYLLRDAEAGTTATPDAPSR